MMRRLNGFLVLLALVQLVLAGGLVWGSGRSQPEPQALMDLDMEAVKTLRLAAGPDDNGVVLERQDGTWQVAGNDGFPAKASEVEGLVSAVAGIQPGLPVAQSKAALERFNLTETLAERWIVINEGQADSVTLVIGKSAGANSVYARRADSNAIHEIGFASWRAEPKASAWFKTDELHVPIKDVAAVKLADFTLRRKDDEGGGWRLKGADPDGELSSTKVKEFVAQLVQPTFEAVSREDPPGSSPKAGYTIVTKDDKEVRFDYYGRDGPRLARSDQTWLYAVSEEQLTKVTEAKPSQFVASDEGSANAASDLPSPGGAGAKPSAESGKAP